MRRTVRAVKVRGVGGEQEVSRSCRVVAVTQGSAERRQTGFHQRQHFCGQTGRRCLAETFAGAKKKKGFFQSFSPRLYLSANCLGLMTSFGASVQWEEPRQLLPSNSQRPKRMKTTLFFGVLTDWLIHFSFKCK